MNTQELHDSMATGLAQRGLPSEYAERAAAELADHHRDLVEELTTAGMDKPTALTKASSRLGDQKTLVKKAVHEYQRRHWCGRWPLLTFILGAPLTVVGTWAAIGISLYAISFVAPWLFTPLYADAYVAMSKVGQFWVVWFAMLVTVPSLCAVLFARLAYRSGLGWPWALASCFVVAVLAGLPRTWIDCEQVMGVISLNFSLSPTHIFRWYCGHGIGGGPAQAQLLQWLMPFAVGLFVIWQARNHAALKLAKL
ncbi:MAG: hypothetical protein GXP26_06790 [Planctomycetes bacterium]|nr:hypothetical protein [Planctomycetota bacterium]